MNMNKDKIAKVLKNIDLTADELIKEVSTRLEINEGNIRNDFKKMMDLVVLRQGSILKSIEGSVAKILSHKNKISYLSQKDNLNQGEDHVNSKSD